MFSYKAIKSVSDVFFAAIMLVIASPVIAACMLAIFIEDPKSSPIFTQKRVGLNEAVFSVYKLRTMSEKRFVDGRRLSDSERVLKVGKLLRKTSLDELTQLVNILKGQMSFVGPRPLPEKYLPYLTSEERLRYIVRPGITGLAQTNGRNEISWDRKLKLDIEYVNNLSLVSDMKIIVQTFLVVLSKKGIGEVGKDGFENLDAIRKPAN